MLKQTKASARRIDGVLISGPTLAVVENQRPPGQRKRHRVGKALADLDLDCIKIKLMDHDEGKGWTRTHADRIESLYKRFMYLTYFSHSSIVPTRDVDAFWHQHILDTEKYAADCEQVFGEFIHHFPYFGMRGPEDAANFATAFEETQRIYSDTFGGDYTAHSATKVRCEAGRCGGKCGSPHCKPRKHGLRSSSRPSL